MCALSPAQPPPEGVAHPRRAASSWLTLVYLHVRYGLPLVHGDEPPRGGAGALLLPAAAQVDDQLVLVAVEGGEDGVEPGLAELPGREEVGRYDDLLDLTYQSAFSIFLPE